MTPRVRQYAEEAAQRFDATAEDILGPSRRRGPFLGRRAVILRLRADGFSFPQIGRWLGRHHTTILSAMRERKQ